VDLVGAARGNPVMPPIPCWPVGFDLRTESPPICIPVRGQLARPLVFSVTPHLEIEECGYRVPQLVRDQSDRVLLPPVAQVQRPWRLLAEAPRPGHGIVTPFFLSLPLPPYPFCSVLIRQRLDRQDDPAEGGVIVRKLLADPSQDDPDRVPHHSAPEPTRDAVNWLIPPGSLRHGLSPDVALPVQCTGALWGSPALLTCGYTNNADPFLGPNRFAASV